MSIIEERNRLLSATLVRNLQHRHFEAYFCETSADAIDRVKQLMPEGSTVTWGGSDTIRKMGLVEALHQSNYHVYDRDLATTTEEKLEVYRQAFSCDFYLSSANAISEDGEIVNIDGNGNRVAAISWGPRRVIFIIGINKVTQDLASALVRARSVASPVNAQRFDIQTPCRKDGVCHDCLSKDSICSYIHILRHSRPAFRHVVILVNETLGY